MPLSGSDRISFGPFCLSPSERLLTRDGVPVEIGGRSLDLLAALVEQPGRVLPKRELMKRVWPDVVVEDGSLRFHMYGLRRILGDGEDGARYIATQVGVGYAFVAPLQRLSLTESHDAAAVDSAAINNDVAPSGTVCLVPQPDEIGGALEWRFGGDGDLSVGIPLAAVSAPILLNLSLLVECRTWCASATAWLDARFSGPSIELELRAALGLSLMFTRSNCEIAGAAPAHSFPCTDQVAAESNSSIAMGPH